MKQTNYTNGTDTETSYEVSNDSTTIERLFVPQRTQPPHIGHMSMLEAACNAAEEVVIGIGSANKYDAKNPYTADEREQMLKKSLDDMGLTNYSFVHLDDYNSDQEWLDNTIETAGLDKNTAVVSGNPWVQKVITPQDLIEHPLYDICATKLRQMIADEDPEWKEWASSGTKHYFEEFGGAERIQRFVSPIFSIYYFYCNQLLQAQYCLLPD